jgi:hypothetical protein
LLLDQQLEPVARLQVGVEVDVAAEHVGEREREIDRLAGGVHRRHQRRGLAIDAALHGLDLTRLLDRENVDPEIHVIHVLASHPQQPIAVDFVVEAFQRAVEPLVEAIGLVAPQLSQIEDRGSALDDGLDVGDGDVLRVKQRGERRARHDAGGDRREISGQHDVFGAHPAVVRTLADGAAIVTGGGKNDRRNKQE